MRTLLMLCLVALITGCNRQEKYPDGYINDLPFGLKFYISESETKSIIDSLIEENILVRPYDGSLSYYYNVSLSDGSDIKLSVTPRFYNDSLYYIDIREESSRNNKSEKENYKNAIDFFKAQEINLNAYYKIHDKTWHKCIWSKPEHDITLLYDNFLIIVFEDKLVNDRLNNAYSERIIEEARKRSEEKGNGIKIENSTWDGSVSQVKKYLKSNLKDPDSYESIEWGKVIETDNGYTIRHKYRAKNSFGGYTIENNIFYLDFKGNVIEVTPR